MQCCSRKPLVVGGAVHLERRGLRALPPSMWRDADAVVELWLQGNPQLAALDDARLARLERLELLYATGCGLAALADAPAAAWAKLQELNLSEVA